jgi:uncharacterized protein YcnI
MTTPRDCRAKLAAVLVTLTAAAAVVLLANQAAAHVDVTSTSARPGAVNAQITFSADAESPTAGISQLLVVLPEGIRPADVTLRQAPAGWKLRPAANGYTIAGPALPARTDLVHTITVARLPDTDRLVFKVLQYYSNGDIDRWIQLPQPGAELDAPAPVLSLVPTGTADTPAPSASTPVPAPTDPAGQAGDGQGTSAGWWVAVAAAVLFAGAVTLSLLRRRQARTGTDRHPL